MKFICVRYIKLYTIERIVAGGTHFNAGNYVSLSSIVHVCMYGIV